jgi:Protein of unknown function (DUF2934)
MSNQAKLAATTPTSQTGRSSMTSGSGTGGHSTIPHDRIAKRAYEKWCHRGQPNGTHEQDWYEAEAELHAEMSGQSVGRSSPVTPSMQQPARPAQPATGMPQKPVQRR